MLLPDPQALEDVASELGVDVAFIEKDWHAHLVLSAIAGHKHPKIKPVFTGGTSLSKAHGLIKRFSEDLDFRVVTVGGFSIDQVSRPMWREYRQQIVDMLQEQGWEIQEAEIVSRNDSKFFSLPISYERQHPASRALRPEIKVDFTFDPPNLQLIGRPVVSLVDSVAGADGSRVDVSCVDPIEIAADKLSALAWRVLTRDREADRDDPAMIRHLHDLAALSELVSTDPIFIDTVTLALGKDEQRGQPSEEIRALSHAERLNRAVEILSNDAEYRAEYERFVGATSYAEDAERIEFAAALEACRSLVRLVLDKIA